MIRSALFRSLPAVLTAFVIASCSGAGAVGSTGPLGELPDANSTSASSLELEALWWKDWHRDVVRVSKTIDASGGTIAIPETGLTMTFPQGAVAGPITITVTSDAEYVAYKMEPAGTKFLKDVTVTQSLATTEVSGEPLKRQLSAAYIANDSLSLRGKVPVSELEPSYTVFSSGSSPLPLAHVWIITHFSRYMLASG
jgi:ZU5 domain